MFIPYINMRKNKWLNKRRLTWFVLLFAANVYMFRAFSRWHNDMPFVKLPDSSKSLGGTCYLTTTPFKELAFFVKIKTKQLPK